MSLAVYALGLVCLLVPLTQSHPRCTLMHLYSFEMADICGGHVCALSEEVCKG